VQPEETTITGETIGVTTKTSKRKIKTNKNDPYSYVIKEHYDLFFDKDIDPYVKHYVLYDLDRDGTNELLLGTEWWEGIGIFAVYSIKEGFAVRQEQFKLDPEEVPPPSLFRSGTLRYDFYGEVGHGFIYYRFDSGELKKYMGLSIENDEYFRREYDHSKDPIAVNFIPITEEEFNRLQKEFEGDGQVVELDWKPLAEYGR